MNFLKRLFTTKETPKLEEKSGGETDYCDSSIWSPYIFGSSNGISLLRNTSAWNYYKKIAPVFDSVKRKRNALRTVKPAIYDTEAKEYIYEVDSKVPATQILKLLERPNRDKTWIEFLDSITASYEVTGDIFILVTAINEKSEPLEFFYINPDSLIPTESTEGTVYCWALSNNRWNEKFYYQEDPINGIASFFTQDGMKELWQIKEFNPAEEWGDFFGLSPLNPIFEEIEQYKYSNIHNKSTLKKGATPSAALVVDKEFNLTDAQYNRMKTQIDAKYSGAENAGNVLILEGGRDFKQLSMNNKDMDFLNLLKFVREQIYITKGIPLAMITADSMTMNNFEESKYMMYDTDVLPFADKIFEELSNLFIRRYDQTGRFRLGYNPDLVPALQVKISDTNKKKIDSKVLTTDESRALIGYEEVEGGDSILVGSNMIPLGTNPNEPTQPENKYDYTTPEGKFRLQYEELLNDEGERKFSDDEITKKIEVIYGAK